MSERAVIRLVAAIIVVQVAAAATIVACVPQRLCTDTKSAVECERERLKI